MPWLNQLVMMCLEAPEANSRSPSLDTMLREQDRSLRPARISAQISAIGVRDIVLPPMPTASPSRTKEATSSSDTTFSRKLRSRAEISLRSLLYGLTRLMLNCAQFRRLIFLSACPMQEYCPPAPARIPDGGGCRNPQATRPAVQPRCSNRD